MFLLPFTSPSHATGSTASAWAWLGDADFALHLQELSLSVSQLKPDCQRFFRRRFGKELFSLSRNTSPSRLRFSHSNS